MSAIGDGWTDSGILGFFALGICLAASDKRSLQTCL